MIWHGCVWGGVSQPPPPLERGLGHIETYQCPPPTGGGGEGWGTRFLCYQSCAGSQADLPVNDPSIDCLICLLPAFPARRLFQVPRTLHAVNDW